MANKGCNLRKQDFTNAELICGFSNLQKLEYIFIADCYILCATLFFKYRLKTVQYKNTILCLHLSRGKKTNKPKSILHLFGLKKPFQVGVHYLNTTTKGAEYLDPDLVMKLPYIVTRS